ncbi:MAG: hypothetical protein DRI61_00515 [Chloroflexi bacterium]|nr:MAG: hypothetical protein DRI61_00515 [Chloroflexota bacterium]HDN80918.1 hypothetical protein [Chloroflexota bacterium]
MGLRTVWQKLSGPVKIGLTFGFLGALLTVIGLIRQGNFHPLSILLGILLPGLTWGVVSWAIALAVVEVESEEE